MVRAANGYITLNGVKYQLATVEGTPAWRPSPVMTQEGDPEVPRRWVWDDWSRGMGDSRNAYRGSVELASFAHVGSPGRMTNGPKINTVSITDGGDTTKKIITVTAPADRVLLCGGRYVSEINPTTHAVATTSDQGVGTNVLDAVLFIDHVALAMGDTTLFRKRNASGAYADNTLSGSPTDNRYASSFGLSAEGDLVKGRSFYWQKCSAADFYGTDNNWGTELDIGDRSESITAVFSFQRSDYVFKPEGIYSFDSVTSQERNLIPAIGNFRSTQNRAWGTKDTRLMLCTYGGLIRMFHMGPGRPVGPEELPYNESALVDVYPTATVSMGKWQYTAYFDGTTTYIVLERDAEDGDATNGPLVQVEVIDSFTGRCDAMAIPSAVTAVPELWYGRAQTQFAWVKLRRDGRPAEYNTTTTAVIDLSPNDFGTPFTTKNFRGVEIKARNVDANRTVVIKGNNDNGGQYTVGTINSITSEYGETFWTLATNDSGRELQLTVELTNNNATTPPEVREIALNFEERPELTDGFVAVLDLTATPSGRRNAGNRDSVATQRAAVHALMSSAPFTIIDPEGNSYSGRIAKWEGEAVDIDREKLGPDQTMTIVVRRLDYS